MKNSAYKAVYILICLSYIFLTSCVRYYSPLGRTVIPDQRIVPKETPTEKIWQTNDLIIEYQSTSKGNSLFLSGNITISDRIIYSYPIARTFNVYANLLNVAGIVTSRHNLRASAATFTGTPDVIPFSVTLPVQPDFSAFAFSYDGTFSERGLKFKRRADEITIFYQPYVN